ncbi:MAG: hypothetical protein ACFB0D_12910 [Phormidesmis sp.]
MSLKAEVYREIIKTIAKVFSGVSLALASFISIVFVLTLDIPGNIVKVGGYEVAFTPTLALFTTALSFSFLAIACLIFTILLLPEMANDSINDD